MSLWASWRRKRRGWRRSTDEISKPPCGNSLNSNPKSQAPKKFQTEKTAKLITRVQKKGIGKLEQFWQLACKHAQRAWCVLKGWRGFSNVSATRKLAMTKSQQRC